MDSAGKAVRRSRLTRVPAMAAVGIVLVLSRLCLIGAGPGSMDAALYLTGMAQIHHQGFRAAQQVFNLDTALGYYVLGAIAERNGIVEPQTLLLVLLAIGALCGVAAILLCAALARSLDLGNADCIWLIIAAALMPRFWALSLTAHPVIPACALLLATVLFVVMSERGGYLFAGLGTLSWACCLLFRADLIVSAGAFLFLPAKQREPKKLIRTRILVLILGALLAGLPRLWLLAANPFNSSRLLTAESFFAYFDLARFIPNSGKYFLHTVLAVHPVLFALGFWGLLVLWRSKNKGLAIWLVGWLAGTLFLVPFRDIDFARITCWSHPVWPLAAAFGFNKTLGARGVKVRAISLLSIPLISILFSLVLSAIPPGKGSLSLKDRFGMKRYNQPIGFSILEIEDWNERWSQWMPDALVFPQQPPGSYELRGPDSAMWTLVWLETWQNGPIESTNVGSGHSLRHLIVSKTHHLELIPDWDLQNRDLEWLRVETEPSERASLRKE